MWKGTDEKEKAEYIQQYDAKEGIRLDLQIENMNYNPSLRQIAKIMLSYMWGKFNKTQVKEFFDNVAFHKFLDSDRHDVRYVSHSLRRW